MGCDRVVEAVPGLLSVPGVSSHLHLDPSRAAVRVAREFVCDKAGRLADGDQFALELLTSEVVTNAILHAGTPVQVGVTIGGDALLVVVHDESNQVMPEQQPYSQDGVSGRGLRLLADLADDWGVLEDESGKSVWFCLRAATASARWDGGNGR